MGVGGRQALTIGLAVLAVAAAPGLASADVQSGPLKGPDGVSRSKVLVIGLDGVRWDLVQRLMGEGRLPALQSVMRAGFGTETYLPYQPPQAFTMSAVGWSTIAAGVGPAKHGVVGLFNSDPQQKDKNGYPDFLTRLERVNPAFSTFSVSDWGNLGLHHSGGPIFGDEIDVKHAIAAEDSIPAYVKGDEENAEVASAYLRDGNPDAGFVYFGLVDETGHVMGSTGPDYRESIVTTDARIGRLLAAVEARPTRALERWTVIVTTDHGHQELSYGSILIHGGDSPIERRSFVIASGPGVVGPKGQDDARVVDIAPTVFHQLRVPVDPAWKLDGRSFVTTPVPPDPEPAPPVVCRVRAVGKLARPSFTVSVGAGKDAPALRSVRVRLPSGVALRGARKAVRVRADGRLVARSRQTVTARTVTVRTVGDGARSLAVRGLTGRVRVTGSSRRAWRSGSRPVSVTATAVDGKRTTFSVRLRRAGSDCAT